MRVTQRTADTLVVEDGPNIVLGSICVGLGAFGVLVGRFQGPNWILLLLGIVFGMLRPTVRAEDDAPVRALARGRSAADQSALARRFNRRVHTFRNITMTASKPPPPVRAMTQNASHAFGGGP